MLADGIFYALKFEGSKIKTVASADLAMKYPEALISFLEAQVEFSWPQRSNNNMLSNRIGISACTNQGNQGLKYVLSRDGTHCIISSKIAVEQAPNLVIGFLESKFDLSDCKPLTNKISYGKFFYLDFSFMFHIHPML